MHAEPPLAVAEHDQVLAQEPNLERRAIRLGHLLGQAGRYPMPAHQRAHRGVALDAA